MRNALIRLAPCAVFLSALASAQVVETPTATGNNTGANGTGSSSVNSTPATNLGGANTTPGLGLQGGLNGVTPAPTLTPGTINSAAVNTVVPVVPVAGKTLPIKNVAVQPPGGANVLTTQPLKTAPETATMTGTGKGTRKTDASGKKETPTASSTLDTTAHGIEQGLKTDASGGDGTSVRVALDRAYDSSVHAGSIGGAAGVSGKFSSAREKVAGLVAVANNAAPADAPGLYASAVKTAEETLPAGAAAAVTKAVLEFAARKADLSLSELVQAAYSAATAGQSTEARRLVKSLDKWEELLGAPGRPLISNGDRIKAGVESAIEVAAKNPGAKGSAPRVWLVKRGGSYMAALPGTSVEKLPGLRAAFALKLEKLSMTPLSDAYRAFVTRPGARSAIAARVAMGESVPSAVLSTGWLWLKYMVMRAWSALTAMLPGHGLPVAANEKTLPRLRDAAKFWRDAVGLGEAAARGAGSPRLTVSRARGAFALAMRAAAAHEGLTGENGAVSRIQSLSAEFEAGVKRSGLSGADRLTSGLETIVSGDGGLRHWASRYASDAREQGAGAFGRVRGAGRIVVLGEGPAALTAASLAAASKDMSFTAFGDALWGSGSGSYGAAKISADMRSTENGGSVVLETELGDERLALALDELGFQVVRKGRGLTAKLDAETISADAKEMAEIAADGTALITGAAPSGKNVYADGLSRLLADMKRAPKEAAKTAAELDGTSKMSRAKTVGWVGEYEAVSTEIVSQGVRVIALRDPATGLSKFARIEPLRVR